MMTTRTLLPMATVFHELACYENELRAARAELPRGLMINEQDSGRHLTELTREDLRRRAQEILSTIESLGAFTSDRVRECIDTFREKVANPCALSTLPGCIGSLRLELRLALEIGQKPVPVWSSVHNLPSAVSFESGAFPRNRLTPFSSEYAILATEMGPLLVLTPDAGNRAFADGSPGEGGMKKSVSPM